MKTATVWTMTDAEFAEYAQGIHINTVTSKIKEALREGIASLKRGVEWYYAAGRWLNYVKANKLYPRKGWEGYIKRLGLSSSQAWKYRTLATRFTPDDLAKLNAESFSLDKALGYEVTPEEPVEVVVITETTTEVTETAEPATTGPKPPRDPHQVKVSFGDESKVEVKFMAPGQYEVVLGDKDIYTLSITGKIVDVLIEALKRAKEEDASIVADKLPGQGVSHGRTESAPQAA